MKHAIMTGNPENGFSFTGPFDYSTEAIEYADEEFPDEAWWVITLIEPDSADEEDRKVEQMASALAISKGYNPNDVPINEWAETKERFTEQAREIIRVLASDEIIQDEENDPLEQPDPDDVDPMRDVPFEDDDDS